MTSASLIDKLAGKFIVFDGPDGCGKTTQVGLMHDDLVGAGARVVRTRDPGGTVIGDRIREVLLGNDLSTMDVRCETLLFMASRSQLVSEVIEPALTDGAVVLCDRFVSSTYAYQGAAGYDVTRLLDLARLAVGGTWPHLTVVLDVPFATAFSRIQRERDAMESRPEAFHERVREIFLNLPDDYPSQVHVVDATGSADEVHGRVRALLERVDV